MFEVRRDLHEQLKPFRSNSWLQVAESREVTARMRKALNNTLRHRFSNDREYNGHRASRLFQRHCGRGAGAYNYIWCKAENVPSRALLRTRLACCARAASGHATAALPTSVMNCRRLMGLPPSPTLHPSRFSTVHAGGKRHAIQSPQRPERAET